MARCCHGASRPGFSSPGQPVITPGTSREAWGRSEAPESPGESAESGPHTVALSLGLLPSAPAGSAVFPALTSRVVGVGGWSRRRLEGEMLLVNKPSTPLALIGFVEADTLST